MKGITPSTLILVDAQHLAYRAFFAHRGLSHRGRPSGAVFGILRELLTLKKAGSDRILFCWDYGVPGVPGEKTRPWRKRLLPEYKATRKKDDKLIRDMSRQTRVAVRALVALGYANFGIAGLEADDLLGILSEESHSPVVLYSGDRDVFQLLSKRVKVWRPKEKSLYTREDLYREFLMTPEQFTFYLSLGGDSSDNIKPIPRVAKKTAGKMVLAGVDPRCQAPLTSWCNQFPLLEEFWDDVRKAYEVARIPTTPNDQRLGMKKELWEHFAAHSRWYDRDNVVREDFDSICANWGMKYFLRERGRFFKRVTR